MTDVETIHEAPLIYNGIQSDKYFISTRGVVRNIKTDKCLSPQDTGYLHVRIPHGDTTLNVRIHRAVAETFLSRPEGCDVVNHKDGDKKNNDVSNLEWVSQSDNVLHSIEHRSGEIILEDFIITVPVSGFRTYHVKAVNKEAAKEVIKNGSAQPESQHFKELIGKATLIEFGQF
ncbi:DNA endonuclease [Enterococcus phage EC99P1]|nr:DNA endonuclease [Enterococcus phage EC99P1]